MSRDEKTYQFKTIAEESPRSVVSSINKITFDWKDRFSLLKRGHLPYVRYAKIKR